MEAALGNERTRAMAMQSLAGPPCPESLAYLLEWLHELHGRSGVGMSGLAPLSYTTIRDWSRLTRVRPRPSPDEVRALFRLDGVLLVASRPEKPSSAAAEPTPGVVG